MYPRENLKVCYILAYYSPDYSRTRTLVDALHRLRGVEVLEARNRSTGLWRYVETLMKLLGICVRQRPDLFILGFRGLEFFWPVRLLTWGKPLIFDHMMSPYDSLVNETRRLRKNSASARVIFAYEKLALQAADVVLTDTRLHKQYFEDLFGLPSEKVQVIPISADTLFRPGGGRGRESSYADPFTVLFYGSFLPLHGIDVILAAAETLKNLPIRFVLVGGNRQDLSEFHRTLHELGLKNVRHIDWVDYERLPRLIDDVDLCLGGPFGNTGQGRRVITGKAVQCLAMAKPTIIGAIEEDFGFKDKENCLLVTQGSSTELADAIAWAYQHRQDLPQIGRRGRKVFDASFSSAEIAVALERLLPR